MFYATLNLRYCMSELFQYTTGQIYMLSDILGLEKDVGSTPQKYQESVKRSKKIVKKIFHIFIFLY